MTLPLKIFKMTYTQGKDLIKLVLLFYFLNGVLQQASTLHFLKERDSEERAAEVMSLVTIPILALDPTISPIMAFSLHYSNMLKEKMPL